MSDTNDLLLAHRVLPDENGRSIGRLGDRIDASSEDLSIAQTTVMEYTNVVLKHDRNQTSSLSRNLGITTIVRKNTSLSLRIIESGLLNCLLRSLDILIPNSIRDLFHDHLISNSKYLSITSYSGT